jgi:hypothetical protein
MIIKKALATTSIVLITALTLSKAYSINSSQSQFEKINYSAFTNFAQNLNAVSLEKKLNTEQVKDEQISSQIIFTIDSEIGKNIKHTRYGLVPHKQKIKLKKEIIAKKSKEITLPLNANAENIVSNEDLSSFEINNSNLINIYSFNIEQIGYSQFENLKIDLDFNGTQVKEKIAEIKNQDIEDSVETAQASTKTEDTVADIVTTTQPATERQVDDEEMVMFDYKENAQPAVVKQTIDQKLYERPISKAVQKAISREMGNAPIKKVNEMNTQRIFPEVSTQNETKNTTLIDNQEIDLDSSDNVSYEYSASKKAITKNEAEKAFAESEAFTTNGPTNESAFTLKGIEVNLNTQKIRQARTFEFVPDYDRSERSDDNGSGEISFGYSLSGEMNTQTGVVQSQGMIPTRVELNLDGKSSLEIPLINEEGIQKFLEKKGINIEGNLITLTLNSNIVDTEIDTKFDQRFYFDASFKSTNNVLKAKYVMYAGVRSGNIMVRYLLANHEVAQKIIYVGEGEMYFEDEEFVGGNRETYTLTTRNLFGAKKKELNIDGELINFLNTKINAKKKALNAYEVKIPTMPSGMRKYLEFKHLKDSVFVGLSAEKDLEIPGNEFIAKVLEMNQVNSLKEQCIVQINLSKDIKELKANGKNQSGEMFIDTTYLDNDGNFTKDSELAEKIFIVGDKEGLFNVKLDYTDGSTEFLKSFCSQNSYLIEQL